jgi:hypothetical protein
MGVTDDDGAIIGAVDNQAVLDVLVGNEPPRTN